MRALAREKNNLQHQALTRLNKAMRHVGINIDDCLRSGHFTEERQKDDLQHLKIIVYGSDEEYTEGKQLNIRIYKLGERAIKKRDCHHRNHNNGLLVLNHRGHKATLACLKLLANNNRKPFESNQFGIDLANTGYLSTFGPETLELDNLANLRSLGLLALAASNQ